ncbi:carbohydrate kinase family protein [Yinghuangia seranimata]|uniref:carbohydrate kinase family protein n=1 Tax=Yinghuangia seranimata TaxID=408067 RepID=UPI00248C8D73|nr:carbohydrate kinase [Yinghuangia seranimata]MDI2129545.1 carbohydrate kinase [Yinghuangia seranimata]
MITVVGEALVDLVQAKGGTPVAHPGGSPANVAVGLGRLGAAVRLVSSFGLDTYGELLMAHLAGSAVTVVPGSMRAGRTSVARALLDGAGVATYEFDIAWDLAAAVAEAAEADSLLADWLTDGPQQCDDAAGPPVPASLLADSLCLHTGSIAATLAPGAFTVRHLIDQARGRMSVSYDPNCRPSLMGDPESARRRIESLVALADVVKVSDEDLAWLHPHRDPAEVAADWLRSGPALVVVTLGAKGSYGVCREGEVSLPATPVAVADTVGAGDAYTAGLLDALRRRGLLGTTDLAARVTPALLGELLREASLVSALTCARPGADPPTAAEIRAHRG